jgi:hypothetical protein
MKEVTERQYSPDLWNSFTILVEQLFAAVSCYLDDYPDFSGKIFQLNLCKYEDGAEPKIIAIKKNTPETGLLVLIKDEDSLEWELLEAHQAEYPNSASRVDILMWISYELDLHRAEPAHWLNEEDLRRSIFHQVSDE